MQTISAICRPLNIAIIEDAAHALGAEYLSTQTSMVNTSSLVHKSNKVGSCEYSDITVLSFHPVKTITTAEGGAVLTNSLALSRACDLYAKHGITRESDSLIGESHGPWYYQQQVLGYNYRLSDLQAALGISQMKRIDEFVGKRRAIARRYYDELSELAIMLPDIRGFESSSWHLFTIELTQHDRASVYHQLHKLGIGVNVHYIPIHWHPYYQSLGFKINEFPNAVKFYENALTLPLYPGLTDREQSSVIKAFKTCIK
jgi:dTDP-4-amino-4,6-dideoxygalactose transaminase